MTYEELIGAALSYGKALFAGNADGHGFDHTARVYHNAMYIASREDCDLSVVALAALLHDVDDPKLFHTEDNANARAFLKDSGVDENTVSRVLTAVNAVSFSKNRGRAPETAEGRIVQDADRLDALGAVGIARTFAYGGSHGRSAEDSIRHFHEKLLLLKDLMNTKTAGELAASRHAFLEAFLGEWDRETRVDLSLSDGFPPAP